MGRLQPSAHRHDIPRALVAVGLVVGAMTGLSACAGAGSPTGVDLSPLSAADLESLLGSYDESRTLQSSGKATPIEGADGYVVPDPGSGPGSRDHGPLAVVVGDGHRMVTVHLVQDRPSVSDRSMNSRLASAGKHAAQALDRPMQRR